MKLLDELNILSTSPSVNYQIKIEYLNNVLINLCKLYASYGLKKFTFKCEHSLIDGYYIAGFEVNRWASANNIKFDFDLELDGSYCTLSWNEDEEVE